MPIHPSLLFTLGLLTTAVACGPDHSPSEDTGSTSETATSNGSTSDAPTSSGSSTTGPTELPAAPTDFVLGLAQVKQFEFSWAAAPGAEYYQLHESADGEAPFVQVSDDLVGLATALTVPLYGRVNARYMLRACNGLGCTDSAIVEVTGTLVEAIGYFKASNPEGEDQFGRVVALSADGSTMAVGAWYEDSNGAGEANNAAANAGAVYVFTRDGSNVWTQQAFIKATNIGAGDQFGVAVALSADGSTLAVGANIEGSMAKGIDGDQTDDSAPGTGAAYVYTRDAMAVWSSQAYVKASNSSGAFGTSVALSADGGTLAVGAPGEFNSATGVGGKQNQGNAPGSGAVYVYQRSGMNVWAQQAYVKATNTGAGDEFGGAVALSADGSTLAVGAYKEASSAIGIAGDQADDSFPSAGAVYVYGRDAMKVWKSQAYVKAVNTSANMQFGATLALSGDGRTLAVGAEYEESDAVGIDGDSTDFSAPQAGAAYLYRRDDQMVWAPQAYVKATNTEAGDRFGRTVALSGDGKILAVAALGESSGALGIGGDQADNSVPGAGAVYVYKRAGIDDWAPQAYVKTDITEAVLEVEPYPSSLALTEDGGTLAVGALSDASKATGIGGDPTDLAGFGAGAVLVY